MKRGCCLGVILMVLAPLATAAAQDPALTPVREDRSGAVQVRLTEVLRIGSEDGPDALGRVMGAAFDGRGRIFVADDQNHRVSVFGPDGKLVRHLGRQGGGPGEFQSPWLVAVAPGDSVFVWDVAQARVSVFGPDLAFRRSFGVAPQWVVNGIEFLPGGDLLVAAYGRGERGALHVLDRRGNVRRSFGPTFADTDLAGFEASLLGGSLDLSGGTIAYSRKSPYEVRFFGLDGRPRGGCRGERGWTTQPAAVVVRSEQGSGLEWNRYVHSSKILSVGGGLYLNVVLDPVQDRRVLDLLTPECRLLRRTVLDVPVNFLDRAGDRLLAARTLDYPELVVYRMQVVR